MQDSCQVVLFWDEGVSCTTNDAAANGATYPTFCSSTTAGKVIESSYKVRALVVSGDVTVRD